MQFQTYHKINFHLSLLKHMEKKINKLKIKLKAQRKIK